MLINKPSLKITFDNGTSVSTTSIVTDSIKITEQLLKEDLSPSSNTASLQIKPDKVLYPELGGSTFIEAILKENADIKAVLYDNYGETSEKTLYTGYLSHNFSWKVSMTGEDVLQVNLEDAGVRLLNKPYAREDDTCIRDTFENIVISIRNKCNNLFSVVYDSNVSSDIKNKILVNKISSSTTCEEILDKLCYEFGLVYTFNNNGQLVISKIDLESVPTETIASTGSADYYLYVEGSEAISLSKKAKQYSQVRVKYSTIQDSETPVQIFGITDKIDVPYGQWWDGEYHTEPPYDLTLDELFQSGKTYYTESSGTYTPAQVIIGDPIPDNTYYEKYNNASTVNMIDLDSGKDILYVYPNTVEPVLQDSLVNTYTSTQTQETLLFRMPYDTSATTTLKQHGSTTNLDVLLDNTNASTGTSIIYTTLSGIGRIIRKMGSCSIYRAAETLSSNSEIQFTYESEWVHDRSDAVALAELLNNWYLYCNNTYTFYTEDKLNLGKTFTVHENMYSGLEVNLLLTGREYVCYGQHAGLYRYTAQAISEFDLEPVVRSEMNGSLPASDTQTVSIRDIVYSYAASSDQTQPTSGWGPDIPPLDPVTNKYLWQRQDIYYTDGTSESVYSVICVYGDSGTSGSTVTWQYALTYAGVEPVAADWQDERDLGWYVGYEYWTRQKITDSEGHETYGTPIEDTSVNDIMNSLASFEISSSVPSYDKDLRSDEPVVITLNTSSLKYYSPTFSWIINNTPYTGASVVLDNYTKKTVPDSFDISCTLTSVVNNVSYTVTKTMTINCVDYTSYNENYGILTSNPSGNFVEGDSYVRQVNGNYIPYVYTDGTWTEISEVSDWPTQIAQVRDVIIANGINVPNTSNTLYAYFKTISAQQAQIDTISTSEISLQNGGVIKSNNYAEDASGNPISGFKIDYEGNSSFVNSNVVNSTVSGSFTSNPLETQDETPGTLTTATFGSQAYYNDYDVYTVLSNNISPNTLTSVSGTYGSDTLSNVLLLTSDSQRSERKVLASKSNITSSDSTSGTMPVNCSNVGVSATPLTKNISKWAYTNSRQATTQYKNGYGNWTNFSTSVSGLSVNSGTVIQARQTYDSSDVNYGTYNNFQVASNFNSVSGEEFPIIDADGVLLRRGHSSVLYRSTDKGAHWESSNPFNGETYDATNSVIHYFYGKLFTVVVSSTSSTNPRQALYMSRDKGVTWSAVHDMASLVTNAWNWADTNGSGEIRITCASAQASGGAYIKSTDYGETWTTATETGSIGNAMAYGNGVWLTWHSSSSGIQPIPGNNSTYPSLSFANGYFFWVDRQTINNLAYVRIRTSTNGSTWTDRTSTEIRIGSFYGASKVFYIRGYYYLLIYSSQSSSSYAQGIYTSTDLNTWTKVYNIQVQYPSRSMLNYTGGRLQMTIPSNGYKDLLYLDFGTVRDSDWTVSSVGSLSITYDYSSYSVGANLLKNDGTIAATIVNNNNQWHTSPTVIQSLFPDPTPYYKFVSFNKPSFDARSYNTGSSFTVKFKTYSGNRLSLTQSESGGHTYNVKWNGSQFTVFLDGILQGMFNSTDYFLMNDQTYGANISFTPVGSTDAILVKDVIPKADSQYSLGLFGKEFATGYIDNMYGVLHGAWSVPIITSDYTITDEFAVGTMRPYFINNSSTVNLTMPGDSSQRYIVLENNVVVMTLVSAGKVNRYEALNGGASLSLLVTSSAEPYLMVYVLRIS